MDPTFLFPASGREYVTMLAVSQQGCGGQHGTSGVYMTIAMEEVQRQESKGAKDPTVAMLRSPGSYQGGCTFHRLGSGVAFSSPLQGSVDCTFQDLAL